MAPIFWFAIGARSSRADLDIALAVGQRELLIPAGAILEPTLRTLPGVSVVLDSGAWPPKNPERISLEAYARAILAWRQPDGGWGNLAWAASYDHIGDPGRTQRDYLRLLSLLADAGAADAPIVPVTQHPGPAATEILIDLWHGASGTRDDLHTGALTRPGYAVGGLVPVFHPTRTRVVRDQADTWVRTLLGELGSAVAATGIDAELLRLHLFGVTTPLVVQHAPLVISFDSSGPARQASFGWQKIGRRFNPAFGFSAEKLQTSRLARLGYWLIRYRAAAGLPWQPIADARDIPDDRALPPVVQHMFELAA